MLPAGQLVEHLSVVKVRNYTAKGAGLGVGGSGEPPSGKFELLECPESGFQAIWSSYTNLWN